MRVIDLHCDTVMQLWYAELRKDPLPLRDTAGSGHELMLDIEKMKKGEYLLQNFAMFADARCPENFDGEHFDSTFMKGHTGEASGYMSLWKQATEMIRVFRQAMADNADVIRQVFTYRDIEDNLRNGMLSALLTVEEGGVLEGDLSRLDTLYDAGVRMMTVTWNYDNELGHPNTPPEGFEEDFSRFFRFRPRTDNGLTPLGKEAVYRMSSMGIIPDVSHLSDAGFFDVADVVKGPFAASHSNARAVTGCSRNMTDEMIRTVAEHGGVIGLNYCPAFVMEAGRAEDCYMTLEGLARHARHIMNKGGREVLALGSDFDGIAPVNLEMANASEVQKLAGYLERAGFTAEEIEGIYWKNAMRLYREVL
ncbi:MAG: dipeptidase [Clostridium sp.]|nr:dipeptidase [Clostridium sp.]